MKDGVLSFVKGALATVATAAVGFGLFCFAIGAPVIVTALTAIIGLGAYGGIKLVNKGVGENRGTPFALGIIFTLAAATGQIKMPKFSDIGKKFTAITSAFNQKSAPPASKKRHAPRVQKQQKEEVPLYDRFDPLDY